MLCRYSLALHRLSVLLEDDCRICLAVNSKVNGLFRQQIDEIGYVGRCRTFGQRIAVEIVTQCIGWEEVLVPILFKSLQLQHTFCDFLVKESRRW